MKYIYVYIFFTGNIQLFIFRLYVFYEYANFISKPSFEYISHSDIAPIFPLLKQSL